MSVAAKQEVMTAAPAVQPSESTAIIAMIERASRDDTVNIDKMRELLTMRKELMAHAAEGAFNDAMAKAQSEMRAVAADANNPQTKSKYASYFALDKAVRPIYTRNGFALSFNTEDGAPAEMVRVVCYVTCAGHTRKYQTDMPADGKGAKGGDVMTKTHATGAAMTYGQRYLLKMIFNMAIGEDKDGNGAANGGDKITEEQVTQLVELAEEVGADRVKFCKYLKVEALADLPAKYFKNAVAALEAKRAKK